MSLVKCKYCGERISKHSSHECSSTGKKYFLNSHDSELSLAAIMLSDPSPAYSSGHSHSGDQDCGGGGHFSGGGSTDSWGSSHSDHSSGYDSGSSYDSSSSSDSGSSYSSSD